jgi:secreted PhoX family phosphatase
MPVDHDDQVSNPGLNPSFNDLIDRAVSRRAVLKGSLGLAAMSLFASVGLSGCGGDDDEDPKPKPERMLGFKAVATSSGDTMVVPEGYVAEAILPWGDPINATAPAFLMDASQGSAAQEQQIGDNHDGMAFFGLDAGGSGFGTRSDEGLLVVNHEYINPEYFYTPGSDAANWLLPFTAEKAKKAQAAHGVSVVHIKRASNGTWSHVKGSALNRRITGYTRMELRGPAAGHALLKTATGDIEPSVENGDPTGTVVFGTLNNCANGRTPWGTYLTCEENFNGYFGAKTAFTPDALENRYGLSSGGFGYLWHTVDPRFDLNDTPNEANRHGWVVEIDPFTSTSTPVKHTALGRFKHENAELVVAPNGKLVVYMGDDERNEYLYKFVSNGTYNGAMSKAAASALLDAGTLYVATFGSGSPTGDNRGVGQWIPLIFGENGLTEANGWTSQADVLIRCRQAADRVGATMMDRPEWVTANPKKMGEVYLACTNNNRRGSATPGTSNAVDGTTVAGSARPAQDEANPRAVNNWGHIVRWNENGGDPTATAFAWDLFVVAGNPKAFVDARAGSLNVTVDNTFNSPDGLGFDSFGRLWIQTDGNFTNVGDFLGQGNNHMLCADPMTGEIRRFLVGPSGCEITGLTFTPDRKTMFVNVQHPGEMGAHPNKPAGYTDNDIARDPDAFSKFPSGVTGDRPRSCTVVVRRTDGGVIGDGNAPAATAALRAPAAAG